MASVTRRRLLIVGAVIAIPLIALGWWLFSPLLFDEEVDEEFPMSVDAVVPEDMTPEEVEEEMEGAADQPGTEADESMPEPAPIAVSQGQFRDADSFHHGSGRATIYQLDDGSNVLRLEAFEVTNGPDLHVLLVADPDPERAEDVEGYLDLGSLKGNLGNQNYPIPADVDPGDYGSVVIYCLPFHVIFSVATLSGA